MLKTHRPRGFAWNCPSTFQQSKEIRNFDLDDCILSGDLGSEGDFSATIRAAKRRRIASLADDFLNGSFPEIHSARLDPERRFTNIAYSFDKVQQARETLRAYERPDAFSSTALWEDVLDDREILRKYSFAQGDRVRSKSAADEEIVVTEVEVQASCAPKRHLRSARVTTGPSEDALRQAAELRNRKLKAAMPDMTVESQPYSCPRLTIPETQSPSSFLSSTQETASDCGPSPTPAWTSSKWIKSGVFKLPRKAVDVECSRDELGATTIFTPSQRSRRQVKSSARGESGMVAASTSSFTATIAGTASTDTDTNASFQTGKADHQCADLMSTATGPLHNQDTGQSFEGPSIRDSYRTAEEHEHGLVASATRDEICDDEDSQTQLLRRKGIVVAPRRSWATVNDDAPKQPQQEASIENASEYHQEARAVGKKPSKGRKTKSTGSQLKTGRDLSPARRQSAPTESQNVGSQSAKLPSPQKRSLRSFRTQYSKVTAAGDSPFVYRKKASRSNEYGTSTVEGLAQPQVQVPQTVQQMVDQPPIMKGAANGTGANADIIAGTRVAAQSPRTPLVDEHLNRILPRAGGSSRRSSSIRKALRDELRALGAELSAAPGATASSQPEAELEASGQPESSAHTEIENATVDSNNVENEPELPAGHVVESQPPWQGTQAMLAQAQRNLFTSPEKADTTLYLGDKTTPYAHPRSRDREPLGRLSQERVAMPPLPSTQALLDDWQGWSSIKKPRSSSIRRKSIVQSPTFGKGMISSDPAQAMDVAKARSTLRLSTSDLDAGRRRSSLRFSMSCADSPIHSDPASHTMRAEMPPPSFMSFAATAATVSSLSLPHSGNDASGAPLRDEEKQEELSSFQQAQGGEDSQDLHITITELAEGVLATGVESQTF